MNITEANELRAKIKALEERMAVLEMSHSEQKAPESPAPHVANGQKPTLGLRKN
jgi:hypothetical protein